MTREERYLYHQIHPLKLLTDVTTSFASTWLVWEGQWLRAAAIAFIPSIIASALLWRTDLERYKRSPLGRYVARFLNRKIDALRFGGQLVMWAGAAAHAPWLIPLGFLIVVWAWMNGLWVPDEPDSASAK